MRVWIDITNSPHVLFFRPLIRLLEEDGHEVELTTREYAQTVQLLELHGLPHHVLGPRHGGAGALGKARALRAGCQRCGVSRRIEASAPHSRTGRTS